MLVGFIGFIRFLYKPSALRSEAAPFPDSGTLSGSLLFLGGLGGSGV